MRSNRKKMLSSVMVSHSSSIRLDKYGSHSTNIRPVNGAGRMNPTHISHVIMNIQIVDDSLKPCDVHYATLVNI